LQDRLPARCLEEPSLVFNTSEVTPVSPFPLGHPCTADTLGEVLTRCLGAWLALRPHQPELLIRVNSGSNRRLSPAPTDIPRDTTKRTQVGLPARGSWIRVLEVFAVPGRCESPSVRGRQRSHAGWVIGRMQSARFLKNEENGGGVSKLATCQKVVFFKSGWRCCITKELAPRLLCGPSRSNRTKNNAKVPGPGTRWLSEVVGS
jgi:hypothetical protein